MLEKFIKRDADVFGNLTEQDRGDISTLMERHRCTAASGIAELFVRAALADFSESEPDKNGYDFIGFEDGNIAHDSSYGNVLNPDKLRLQHGLAVLQKHRNDIVQVVIDLIQRFALGMRARKTGNKTNEQPGLCASFNYR